MQAGAPRVGGRRIQGAEERSRVRTVELIDPAIEQLRRAVADAERSADADHCHSARQRDQAERVDPSPVPLGQRSAVVVKQ